MLRFAAVCFISPLFALAANLNNWEGGHIDVAADNRAIDWWYTQVIGQTPAANGVPPSMEIVLKHGNTFQFGNSNTPLYPVEIHGYDNNGQPFGKTIQFTSSTVGPDAQGQTIGSWTGPAGEITFIGSADLETFTITVNAADVSGTMVIQRIGHQLTGCGGDSTSDSPFFESLVSDGRFLTPEEVILYKKTGWRITAPGGASTVDFTFQDRQISFSGPGYKDSNWGPNAMNDFIRSWFVIIAEVGPYSFVTFSGQPRTGANKINAGHLLKNGQFISNQCNIIGERQTDISIITPSGAVLAAGVTAPTAFNIRFVLESGEVISFDATNLVENPAVSVYHRWVAKYVGGAEGESFESFGITEWMNPANISHWELI